MYLLDILPLAVSIRVFSLALSYAKLPKQKVTFVCSFGFSRKRITRPPVRQPCCYYGRILLLGRRNALGTFVREGDAVGGGETPRLWGVTSKLCLLRVCSFCFVCSVASLAPGSAVLRVLLPPRSMVCLIICPLGFWLGKGCLKVWVPFNCLVFRQAVCDTYVNQVNKQ